MNEITRLNHIGIRVSNLDKAREFYEKIGFEFIVGPIGPEPVAIMEHPSGININFILNASQEGVENVLMDISLKHTGYTHMALEITNLESVKSQLESKNIAITGGPITLPDGATFIFVRDPDSNVIEFHKPA
ncbi:MAG: VOC family protein [Halioglobus sp.]|nr:VOC family protein [Halioglobus sp.]